MPSALGAIRRLRALSAIGYSQNDMCRASGLKPSTLSHLIRGTVTRTSQRNIDVICKMYDRLSMTPGPSQRARAHAKRNCWAPPLAWDDNVIDDLESVPDFGQRSTVDWPDKYRELREHIGLTDDEIAARLGIERQSLQRQLDRHGITA